MHFKNYGELDFDAREWATEFLKTMVNGNGVQDGEVTLDYEIMVTWFANALMKGYDFGKNERKDDDNVYLGAGWMLGEACNVLDKNEDLRTKEIPEMLERMEKDLKLKKWREKDGDSQRGCNSRDKDEPRKNESDKKRENDREKAE